MWPACRGTVYCTIGVPGRAGHAEQEHPHWRDGGAVNAVDKGRFLLDGVDRLRREWRTRADLRHPLLDPPDIVATRFVADAGWHVTIPDRAEIDLSVLILPQQADAQRLDERTPATRWRRTCAAGATTDSWLAEHPPTFRWHTEVNPSETPVDAPSVQALLGANAALGLPRTLGGLGSWYDGATFALETGTPALMYGPRAIDWAHTVGEYVADRRPRRVRAGHRDRGAEALPLNVRAAVLRAPGAAVEVIEVELDAPRAGEVEVADRRGGRVRVRRARRGRRLGRADAGGAGPRGRGRRDAGRRRA